MRPIDGDSLKEEISNLTIKITGIRAGKGVLAEFMREYRKTILRTIDEQPTIEQYGTWIPCSERLPEESVKVLIFTDKGHCYIGRLYEENEWFCISEKLVASKVEFSKVIAWMPLPLPYREEKKDE